MNIKTIIKICVSVVFIILSLFFIFCLQVPEIKKAKFDEAKNIIIRIDNNLKSSDLNEKLLNSVSNDFFYALWVKEKDRDWLPVFYNDKYLKENELTGWFNAVYKNSPAYEVFPGNTPYTINGRQYIMWINKYNIDYVIKYIILALLFLILIYLIFLTVIELMFAGTPLPEPDIHEFHDAAEDHAVPAEGTMDEVLYGYRELWQKNFKISDDFRNNFPLDKINGLIRIAVTPSTFIADSLEFSCGFFGWKNPKIYIRQNNIYIDAVSGDTLDESKIKIPLDGNQKGPAFIPLFPYSADNIYGYLYFEWNKENKFFIADVLYFLKFIFSDKTKNIFLKYNELERIISVVESKLDKGAETSVTLIEADGRDKIKSGLKKEWLEKLNHNIRERLIEIFTREMIFTYDDLLFFIISENPDKNDLVLKIEKWMNDVDLQLYDVSPEYGNIALSYTCGAAFKSGRNIHPLSLVKEAEDNLKRAIDKGRNEIVY